MISQDQLERIGRYTSAQAALDTAVGKLRNSFPDVHFTYCLDDDVMSATPVLEEQRFNLYLIDSSDHCLCFTQDMGVATGVVVAEIEDE